MPTEPSAPRALAESEFDQFLSLDELAFGSEPPSAAALEIDKTLLERDRTIGVFDGAQMVAGASIFSFEMTVPGGRIPMAGVSWVSVMPTHRRRGILSSMMRHQLHDLHESGGEAVAGLTASEPPIYGRFGYGLASRVAQLTIPRQYSGLRMPAGSDAVSLRFVSTEESREACEEVYARQVPKRPGMLVRSPAWADAYVADPDDWRADRSRLRTVLAERDGQAVGYTRYRVKQEFSNGAPAGRVSVSELYGDDAAVQAVLLRYVTSIDLMTITELPGVPLDAPPLLLLENVRAANVCVRDSLYIRLIDVDQALASRTYSAQIDVVIDVTDSFCPWNAGRWRLTGGEKGATCERTSAAPDIALGVRELGSVFLGGASLTSLGAAGLVEERRNGALAEASRAFVTDLEPWMSFGF
jgi:predicted acetyltransferase